MDSDGNLYVSQALRDAMEKAGESVSGVRVASEEAIARIAVKPGAAALSEGELKHLAALPRRQRRAALAELRRRR